MARRRLPWLPQGASREPVATTLAAEAPSTLVQPLTQGALPLDTESDVEEAVGDDEVVGEEASRASAAHIGTETADRDLPPPANKKQKLVADPGSWPPGVALSSQLLFPSALIF